MEPTVKAFKAFGIEVHLAYSWFLIFIFATIVMAMQFDASFPFWSPTHQFIWGLATSLLFFASILGHEAAHSLVARYHKIRVHSITLHVFGGWARLSRPARSAYEEFTIAVAGPVSSLLIALLFLALWFIGEGEWPALALLASRLAWINVILAIFNTLPAFPLDGGLALRALLWHFSGQYIAATRYAAYIGQMMAGAFIVTGVMLFMMLGMAGLWFIVIGYNFFTGAIAHLNEAKLKEDFRFYKVGDLTLQHLTQINNALSVREFLDTNLTGEPNSSFLVMDENIAIGVVTGAQANQVAAQDSELKSVREIMTPIYSLELLDAGTNVVNALELMDCSESVRLPVVQDRQLQGFIGRESLVDFIASHFNYRAPQSGLDTHATGD